MNKSPVTYYKNIISVIAGVISQLKEIEKKHADFFEKTKTNITDYIADGNFTYTGFSNINLPPEIVIEIQKVFDKACFETDK